MRVQRDGVTYSVEPLHDEWRFWEDQFTGPWEPATKAVIDTYVDGGTYVDLGAWVGPTVLWASAKARRVVAVEPDPVAYRHLQLNTGANCSNVVTIRAAVGAPGRTLIRTAGEFGDSLSSTLRGTKGEAVDAITVEMVVAGATDVQLIKMDIEGAEGDVIPRESDYLRELGAPLLLSVHPTMWLTDPVPFLAGWHREDVARGEILFTP